MQDNIKLKPEYGYLDPVSAFNFQRQSFLVNLINYPIEESEPGKLDPIANWVGSVFVAPQNTDNPTFFEVSPLAKKFARFLSPSAIGGILNHLALAKSEKEKVNSDPRLLEQWIEQLKHDLKKQIEDDPEFRENIKQAKESADQFQSQMDELEHPERLHQERGLISIRDDKKQKRQDCSSDPIQLNLLEQELKKMNKEIESFQHESKDMIEAIRKTPEHEKLREKRDLYKYETKYLDSFLDKLVHAWTAEGSEKLLEEKGYPSHVIEKTLMALAWMNTQDGHKAQFVALYEKIPHFLVEGRLPLNKSWIQNSYTAQDYKEKIRTFIETNKTPEARAHYLLEHPEEAAFLSHGHGFFDQASLPEIGYKSVDYQSKTQGKVSFSDCMESSILNFLAITLKNPKTATLDPNLLREKLGQQSPQLNPEFMEFSKKYPHLNSLDTTAAHEKWASLLSDLDEKEIKYVQKGYEMDTEISNIFNSMDHLLYHQPFLKNLKTNQEKMDHLCQHLSLGGRNLEWSILEGKKEDINKKNTDLAIEFFIDGNPSFIWRLSSGHAEIHTLAAATEQTNWKKGLTKAMIPLVGRGTSDLGLQTLLGVSEHADLGLIIKNLGREKGVIRTLALDSNELKLKVYEEGLKNQIASSYPLLKKLEQSLPINNHLINQSISAAQADSDYPWGDPIHAVGKPDVKYTRLSNDPKFLALVNTHKQSLDGPHQNQFVQAFNKPWIDPRGVLWGNLIKKEDGSVFKMSYEQAMAYCESIHAHLPTKEKWEALHRDMSNGTAEGYLPQFLSNLFENRYWTSTILPSNENFAYRFDGSTNSSIYSDNRKHTAAVRCVL